MAYRPHLGSEKLTPKLLEGSELLSIFQYEHIDLLSFYHNFERAVEGLLLETFIILKGNGFSIQDMMEVNNRTSHSNEKRPLETSRPLDVQKKATEYNNPNSSVFVNHDCSCMGRKPKEMEWECVPEVGENVKGSNYKVWSTTYEDLLSTQEAFPEPIPLSEMVDFLVDIWHDEGLFD
ncbi:hypothetical protein OROMI_010428 [Orobanche minor]